MCGCFFLPRRFRIVCFWIVTPFQFRIILTGNYAFLNYLVLSLGFLLLDDRFITFVDSAALERRPAVAAQSPLPQTTWPRNLISSGSPPSALALDFLCHNGRCCLQPFLTSQNFHMRQSPPWNHFVLPTSYGLFAVMTHARYEIEFQGSNDGQTWTAYSFRYKPQDVHKAPGIYAPYQPRFDWNLWFASLGSWGENPFVLRTEEQLLLNSPDVLALFAGNPFPNGPPQTVRSVLWQYWFTDLTTKRKENAWWRRELLGPYAPALQRRPDGSIAAVAQ